jgi:hypothetical protein
VIIVKTHTFPDGTESSAHFSECMKYRYALNRFWKSPHKKLLVFVLLNPSKATEIETDGAVTRCETRARSGTYRGVTVLNLFAFRATDPAEIKAHEEPVGGYANTQFLQVALACVQEGTADIICGWGNHGTHLSRNAEVLSWFDHYGIEPMALDVTKDGNPWHPLYLGYDVKTPIPLKSKA